MGYRLPHDPPPLAEPEDGWSKMTFAMDRKTGEFGVYYERRPITWQEHFDDCKAKAEADPELRAYDPYVGERLTIEEYKNVLASRGIHVT